MNKKWTIILFAAIFILANVATFLFAYGKVKIAEKIVTIYKGNGAKEERSLISASEAKTEATLVKSEPLKTATLDFNDTDYSPDSRGQKEAEITPDGAGEPETAEDATTAEAVKSEEAEALSGHTTGTTPAPFAIVNDENPTEVRVADEGIPIPQLPLFDTDFEVDIDRGGDESIASPLLPDVSI